MTSAAVQNLLDVFPALYCVIDDANRFMHVGKGATSLLGYLPSELKGKSLFDLVAEEDYPQTQKVLEQLYSGQHIPGFLNRFRHKNGHLVPISWNCILDPQTKWIYGLGQKAPLSGSVQQAPAMEGQIILDESWRIIHINEAAAAMTGKTGTELLQRSLWDCFPEARGTIFETEYQKALEQKLPVRFECFCPTLHRQWMEVNAFPFGSGLSVFFRNIDTEKSAQEEIWKLSLIARETNNIVVLTDASGLITWVNEAFTRITGYSFEEANNQSLSNFLSGNETDASTMLGIQEAIAGGQPFQAEILHYSKDGRKIWVELQGQPVKDAEGRVQQFFSIETDITQRKLFEERLEKEQQQRQRTITRATIEAQERERSLVSQELHDNVNQVLTTVKLYTELCLSGIAQKEELMRKSVQLLQNSINEIRALSKRLSAPTLGKVRLRDSVRELSESIEATNRLQVDTNLSALQDLDIPQDLHLAIYRILQEHFTNILKHASATSVQVSFELVNDELVLKVRDDGQGFNTKDPKNGIGIANMLSRAESLRGTMTLNSAPGLGCVLLVRFPMGG